MQNNRRKSILIFRWNGITPEIEEGLRNRGHDVTSCVSIKNKEDIKNYDIIVHWNETDFGYSRKFIKYMQDEGKKVVMYQHGRRGTPRILPPFNEPLLSDITCVWGQTDKDKFLSVGTPEERVKVVGTTIFQHLKPREKHEGINVVFSPEHWDTDVVENQIIASKLRELQGVKIITKLLKDEHNPDLYDNPVVSDRRSENHLNIIADVLKTADLVVSPIDATFELLAEYLDIPVVLSDIWIPKDFRGDERYKYFKRVYSGGCRVVKDINKLNDVIYQQLKHPEELKKERLQTCIEDGGIDIKDPVKAFCDVIDSL